ncbi:hypothetical protein ACSBR2_029779 [Camellia fascicularis]
MMMKAESIARLPGSSHLFSSVVYLKSKEHRNGEERQFEVNKRGRRERVRRQILGILIWKGFNLSLETSTWFGGDNNRTNCSLEFREVYLITWSHNHIIVVPAHHRSINTSTRYRGHILNNKTPFLMESILILRRTSGRYNSFTMHLTT